MSLANHTDPAAIDPRSMAAVVSCAQVISDRGVGGDGDDRSIRRCQSRHPGQDHPGPMSAPHPLSDLPHRLASNPCRAVKLDRASRPRRPQVVSVNSESSKACRPGPPILLAPWPLLSTRIARRQALQRSPPSLARGRRSSVIGGRWAHRGVSRAPWPRSTRCSSSKAGP